MASRKIIGDILADYRLEALRHKNMVRKIRDEDPEISRIDASIRATGSQLLGLAFNGGDRTPLDRRLEGLEELRRRRLQELHVREYLCDKCQDTGILDGKYCACLRRRIYLEHYGAMDPFEVPRTLDTYPCDVFDDSAIVPFAGKTQKRLATLACNVARVMVQRLPGTPQGMLMVGPTGTGKTWLAGATARSAAEKGVDVCFIHARSFFDAYHMARLGRPVDPTFLESSELLIVDDLGTEPRTANVTNESLVHVLTRRMEAGLPSVFVTNLTDLQATYGERVSSRLLDKQAFVEVLMNGSDLRQLKRRRD